MASLSQPRENSKFDSIQCNLSRKRYCNNSRIGLDFYPGIIPCTFLLYSFENESSFRKNADALKTIFLHAFTLKKAFKIMKFRYKILYTTCMCYIQTRCRLFTLYSLILADALLLTFYTNNNPFTLDAKSQKDNCLLLSEKIACCNFQGFFAVV